MAGVLSIDPGAISAAWAHHDGGRWDVGDVPVVNGNVNAVSFALLVRELAPVIAVIEQVASMPKQGVASTFKFGMGCGLLRGVLAALTVPTVQVPASHWKRQLKLNGKNKEGSRAMALRLFPHLASDLQRVKDSGRAEALLIGHWYLTHFVSEQI